MERQSGNLRIKSRGLEVPCNTCAKNTPYDPTDSTAMCSDCLYDVSAPMEQDTSDLVFAPRQQSGYHSNRSPMTPSSSLKRRADSPLEGESSKKRAATSDYGSSNSSLVRRTVVGPAAQVYGRRAAFTDDEDEDEFEDAPEEQPPKDDDDEYVIDPASEDYENDNATSATEQVLQHDEEGVTASVIEEDADEVIETGTGEGAYEEPDLFNSTFANKWSEDSEDEAEEEYEEEEVMQEDEDHERGDMESEQGSDEGEQEEERQLSSTNVENKPAGKAATGPENVDFGHVDGVQAAHGYPPAPTSSHGSTQVPGGPPPPDPDHDLSSNLKRLQSFHNRAKDLIPRLPLPEHRYWIGVLNLDVNPKSFSQEKHFTWMKGNRLTTVSTVWHTYQTTTATDNFVLLLGFERVDFKDKMEELDYFNEKKIMFRAVWEGAPGSEGRSLIEGIVPPETKTEVIEID